MPQRIAVVGPVASGKSTLAAAVAAHTGLHHVDLDQLFWGPGWTPVTATDFHAAARQALAGAAWIADGNYGGSIAEILLKRAELTIWLDLPLRTCLPRLIRRSIRRAVTGEELFAGNRETFGHLVSRDSILWWGPAHHHRHRRRWEQHLPPLTAGGLPVLRLNDPAAVAPRLLAHGLLAHQEA